MHQALLRRQTIQMTKKVRDPNENPGEQMKIVQITHNDLDGYGASTIAAMATRVSAVAHVTRYKDVVETFWSIVQAVKDDEEPTTILMTDIGIERQTALALVEGSAILEPKGHRVVVLDHHASSVGELELVAVRDGNSYAARGLTAVVDETMSATSLTYAHAGLYGADGFSDPLCDELCKLVDVVDLWRTGDAHFMRGMAVNDAFWDMVGTYVPLSHPSHDPFVSSILKDLASLSLKGASAADIEDGVNAAKRKAVDAIAGPDPMRESTSRLRLAAVVASDRTGFAEIQVQEQATLVTFAMDMGIFQRVSEILLEDPSVDLVVNVMRSAGLSLRSRRGQALKVARAYGGGGHPNASGGDLGSRKCFSLAEAVALFKSREGSS